MGSLRKGRADILSMETAHLFTQRVMSKEPYGNREPADLQKNTTGGDWEDAGIARI